MSKGIDVKKEFQKTKSNKKSATKLYYFLTVDLSPSFVLVVDLIVSLIP